MTRQEREIRGKLLSTGYLIWMTDRSNWRENNHESYLMSLTAKTLATKWLKQGLVSGASPYHVQLTYKGSEVL